MKCFKCGYELPPDAVFCPHCGQNNDDTPHFCAHCGAPLDKTTKFCEKCGTPVAQTPPQEDEEEGPSAEEVKEKAEEIIEKLKGLAEEESADISPVSAAAAPTAAPSTTQITNTANSVATKVVHTAGTAASPAATEVVQAAGSVAGPVATGAAQAAGSVAGPVATGAAQAAGSVAAPVATGAAQTAGSVAGPVATGAARTAGSVAGAVATGAARTAGSVAGAVATGAARTAGTVAVEGAKKAGSVAKTIAIWTAVLAFIVGAAAACLNFFVPAPNETVDKLITSVEELNYDDMLSCFDSTTEKQIRAIMGITGDLLGSLTGISIDLEDLMALAPSMAPYLEIPDLGIASAETVLYADCSKTKIMQYCTTANNGGTIPTGYLSDNAIINFLGEYNITLPGLENLIAEAAIVKITLASGEVGYLPLINEGWGDWRIPIMDLAMSEGLN